jgi:integrase
MINTTSLLPQQIGNERKGEAMSEEIKVHVVKYPDRKNLVMRYLDPFTNKHVQRSTGTAKKSAAEKEAGKWQAELNEGRYKAQSRMTWDDFREKYESEVLPGLSEGTGDCKASAMNYIENTINPHYLRELTTPRLSAFVAKLREGGMKDTTLSVHLAHLKPILRWAVRQGYLRSMPDVDMPKRAKGISQAMRGRPLVEEELDRMIDKVPEKRKREPKKWQQLLRGLWWGGLRLSEALALSWDEEAPISVCMRGKYPTLRIQAEAQKSRRDQLLPIAPEFAEMLLAVPEAERHGLVFGIYGQNGQPLSTKRASRYISSIGKAANVVTNKAENRHGTAHDLRRAFCTRWARRIMPADLNKLARHASMNTTMQFYVSRTAEDVGDMLRLALGTNSGTSDQKPEDREAMTEDAKQATIES